MKPRRQLGAKLWAPIWARTFIQPLRCNAEASGFLVSLPVFKTGEAGDTRPGGFDSRPPPLQREAF